MDSKLPEGRKPLTDAEISKVLVKHVAGKTVEQLQAQEIEELKSTVEKLTKALAIYAKERERFQHTHPELTGAYFLTGGHGEKDANMLPRFVTICPAYGAAWLQVYEKTDRTISYEGS